MVDTERNILVFLLSIFILILCPKSYFEFYIESLKSVSISSFGYLLVAPL